MVGEPHALPYITSSGGQIDQGDDTIFASESGIWYHKYEYECQYQGESETVLCFIASRLAIIAATTAGAVFAVLGVGYCYHR